MIERMRKYSFVIYQPDYLSFLAELQKLGMVHLVRSTDEKTDTLTDTQNDIEAYLSILKTISPHLSDKSQKIKTSQKPIQLRHQFEQAKLEKDQLTHRLHLINKEIANLLPWGVFSPDLIMKLAEEGICVDLYSCSKSHFQTLDN